MNKGFHVICRDRTATDAIALMRIQLNKVNILKVGLDVLFVFVYFIRYI